MSKEYLGFQGIGVAVHPDDSAKAPKHGGDLHQM